MPDLLIKPTPAQRDPLQLVVESKHDLDWGTSDELLEATEARLHLLGDLILNGAWFLNPKFTVRSRAVSAGFFRAAQYARSRWLKETRQSISLRRESRSVVVLGRRAALADIGPDDAEDPPAGSPPATPTLAQRLEVTRAGHIARQMAFTGLMIIDGNHVPPRTWNRMADELLGPEPTARIGAHRRRSTLSNPRVPSVGRGHLSPVGNLREQRDEGV